MSAHLSASCKQSPQGVSYDENLILNPGREDADGCGKAKGQTGCHRSGFVEMGRRVVTAFEPIGERMQILTRI